jgi:uncharacterized protein
MTSAANPIQAQERNQLVDVLACGRDVADQLFITYIFYVIFYYGIGFGMIGVLHLQSTISIALSLYSIQVVFSRYWMSKTQYGPIEWLRRQATYGKRLPLLRQTPN